MGWVRRTHSKMIARTRGASWGAWLALAACACQPSSGDGALLDAGASPADAAVAPPRCSAPQPAAPESIADVVALVNGLPKPVSLPCVLEALPHPLAMQAADSILSAQPAEGARSPRIFVFLGPLVLSVVPDGMGASLLEFGERRSETHTLKAEIEFPITQELDAGAPYERLRFDEENSTCGFCHGEEERVADIDHPFARSSRAIKPMPSQRVPIAGLQRELLGCDTAAEPERCAMLDALFGDEGRALEHEFPAEWKTFF